MKAKTAVLKGKPDVGSPHVRFDGEGGASEKTRRGSLLYKIPVVLWATLLVCCPSSFGEIRIFPEQNGNLRNLKLVQEFPRGAKGHCLPFSWGRLTYRLTDVLSDRSSGEMRFMCRDYGRWRDGASSLRLQADGEKKQVVRIPGKITSEAFGPWEPCQLTWKDGIVRFRKNDGAWQHLLVSGDKSWTLDRLEVDGMAVDELTLATPSGTFRLDWEGEPFAACVSVTGTVGKASVAFQGFDSYFISEDRTSRDRPTLIVRNAGAQPVKAMFDFVLTGELTGLKKVWTQETAVPAGMSADLVIGFPEPLESDIYHLEMSGRDGLLPRTRKHLAVASRRPDEKKGTVRFGFHNGARRAMFSDPEALPLDYMHQYWTWAYTVVVPWSMPDASRNKPDWGEDPNRSPDAWSWAPDEASLLGCPILGCVLETPFADWQRLRLFGGENKRFGSYEGGEPNYPKLKEFVRECLKRRGRNLMAMEASNEPNCNPIGKHPESYAKCVEAEAEALHAFDPSIPLFYVSGTGSFQDFQRKVDKCRPKGVAGLSLHTYCTPEPPERCGLAQLIEGAKKEAETIGVKRYGNTETGVACVGRFDPMKPIPADEVRERVRRREKNFFAAGWPGAFVDEWQAARTMVKNATVNFAMGAEFFTYFGWNDDWIVDDWPNPKTRLQDWIMVTGTPSGGRTPNYLALAVGVQIQEMQGVLSGTGTYVQDRAAYGAVFEKANGGALAVLSRHEVDADARLLADVPELERVSYLGRRDVIRASGRTPDGRHVFRLHLTSDPHYYHAAKGRLAVEPCPLRWVAVNPKEGRAGSLNLAFAFDPARRIRYSVAYDKTENVITKWVAGDCQAMTNKYAWFHSEYELPGKSNAVVHVEVTRDDGAAWTLAVPIKLTPQFEVPRVTVADPKDLKALKSGTPLVADSNEQCVIGGYEKTASLADPTKWGGPDELSAKTWLGYDDRFIYVYGEVKEKVVRVPEAFPGVWGSCVELFFDMRVSSQNPGQRAYTSNTYQMLLVPSVDGMSPTLFANMQSPEPERRGYVVSSGPTSEGYWYSVAVPWAEHPMRKPCEFRFDVSVDGCDPLKEKPCRKTQLATFGTANNCADASGFARAVLKRGSEASAPQ